MPCPVRKNNPYTPRGTARVPNRWHYLRRVGPKIGRSPTRSTRKGPKKEKIIGLKKCDFWPDSEGFWHATTRPARSRNPVFNGITIDAACNAASRKPRKTAFPGANRGKRLHAGHATTGARGATTRRGAKRAPIRAAPRDAANGNLGKARPLLFTSRRECKPARRSRQG